jgi:transaldolase
MQLSLKTKIFADGAEKASMLELHNNPLISGFTTNPTLMRKAGIKDYNEFAQDILKLITDKPVSFEVFSDNFDEMERQAIEIARWGSNVIVKIPITNTKGESSVDLIGRLSAKGIKINATAMMTIDQVISVLPGLSEGSGGYVSIFAGRIADAGVDPLPVMKEVMELLQDYPNIELIWASPRELFNIVQANEIGCHIITVTNDILKKLPTIGKDLTEFSLDTVKMFFNDASAAGYSIKYASEKVLL